MYYDKNRRYFEKRTPFFYIGLGFMAAAFILFFVWPVDMDNYRIITITVVPVLIAGCVMFFGSLLRRSSESEIDEEVLKMLQGFEEKARFELDVYEKELPYIISTRRISSATDRENTAPITTSKRSFISRRTSCAPRRAPLISRRRASTTSCFSCRIRT